MAAHSLRRRYFNAESALMAFLYRRLGGSFVRTLAGKSQLMLLTTTGRKSRRQRTVPVRFMREGDAYVVTASNVGADEHPGWFLNLCSDPHAAIQVGDAIIKVVAEQVNGDERQRLWAAWLREAPGYARFQQKTRREFPMLFLHPT